MIKVVVIIIKINNRLKKINNCLKLILLNYNKIDIW